MRKFLIAFFGCFLLAASVTGVAKEYSSLNDIPYAGLVLEKVDLDGVEISDFRFENDHRIMNVDPKQEFSCFMNYKIDADELKTLHLNHVVIGLSGDGPQECIIHSLGIKDAQGSVAVKLVAPEDKGVYEVVLSRSRTLSCEKAKKEWWKKKSGTSVVGFLTVL